MTPPLSPAQPVSALPVAIYARVSTRDQATSITGQLATARRYASEHGLTVGAVYIDEGVSGSIHLALRPSGARLIADIEAGRVGGVVAVALDRLWRDTIDAMITRASWHGLADLHLVSEGGCVADSAEAELIMTMRSALASYERTRISQRVKRGVDEARARGARLGRPSWGERRVVDASGQARVEADPSKAGIIAGIVAAVGAGESYRSIARRLEAETGEAWTATKVRRIATR